jgi:hypothetical protein
LLASDNIVFFTSYAIRWIDNALKEASLALDQPHFLRRFSDILSVIPLEFYMRRN